MGKWKISNRNLNYIKIFDMASFLLPVVEWVFALHSNASTRRKQSKVKGALVFDCGSHSQI